MKKQLIEIQIKNKINENSVLMYSDGKWCVIDKAVFLNELYESSHKNETDIVLEKETRLYEITELQRQIDMLKSKVKYLSGEELENEENISEN